MSENEESLEPVIQKEVSQELLKYRHSIAIVTATRYPNWYKGELKDIADTDKVRGDLALEAIRNSSTMGYQTVVVDAESSPQFEEALSGMRAHIFSPDLGTNVSAKRRQGFKGTLKLDGVKAICTTEPEKVSLITDCIDRMVAPIIEDKADVVIGKRDPELYKATYPDYQYDSEVSANKRYNSILRLVGLRSKSDEDLDMIFGPVALRNSPEILELFMKVYEFTGNRGSGLGKHIDPEKYSDTLLYPVMNALHQGIRVASVEVPFQYPSLQKQNEEINPQKDKRRAQKFGLLGEEVALVRTLLNKRPKLTEK